MSVKGAKIFNLIYHHNNLDLYRKRIALWYLAEPGCPQNHSEHFISLIKHLINAGSGINIYLSDKSILNMLPPSYAITFYEEMHNCLPHSKTLVVFGKIQSADFIKACSLSKKQGLTLIIECKLLNHPNLHKCSAIHTRFCLLDPKP